MAVYDPDTQTVYSTRAEAQRQGRLGLPEATVEPRPVVTVSQEAVRDALPTQNPDDTWSFKWTVQDLTQAEIDAKVEQETDRAAGISDSDKAIAMLIADLWLYISQNVSGMRV